MNDIKNKNEVFSPEMTAHIKDILGKMEGELVLKLSLDQREVSKELEAYLRAMTELTDKLTLQIADRNVASDDAPCAEICLADGSATGLAFHGVPAEHELDPFLLGLCHATEAGRELDESIRRRISSLKTPLDMKVLVTLTCPMCPELVVAAQQIAAINPGVTAHIYDIRHFETLSDRYRVMSVPCLVINGDRVSFGRRNLRELLELLEK